jgi:2',3'-cyclic-nucleotide 2'-phosphodiesterase
MKILFIGDIVGKPGRDAIAALVPGLRREFDLDFVIANAENAAGGSGITYDSSRALFSAGVDVLTSGDHIWKKKDIFDFIEHEERLLRPVNYPSCAPGRGFGVFTNAAGKKIGVINVNGRVFMEALECPFRTALEAAEKIRAVTPNIVVDVHAEATSEKVALGWYLDGKVSAVLGTHTHIQTADERVLPQGTGYLTDAGMTGPYDSVIGRQIDCVLQKFVTAIPTRFDVALENVQLHGVVVDIDDATGRARVLTRIQRRV